MPGTTTVVRMRPIPSLRSGWGNRQVVEEMKYLFTDLNLC
jgi:hypothetical protein